MKKVAIYVRVSTQEQAVEGYSISEQIDRLTKFCEAHSWKIYKVYTDPGFSGGNMNRPSLQKLFADCTQKRFDTVLVYKLDRLSRSQKDTLYIIEDLFLTNHVDFISMSENFDTSTPFGRAMIGILSVFAQLEREQIKDGKDGQSRENGTAAEMSQSAMTLLTTILSRTNTKQRRLNRSSIWRSADIPILILPAPCLDTLPNMDLIKLVIIRFL